jgi:hypothetical protein
MRFGLWIVLVALAWSGPVGPAMADPVAQAQATMVQRLQAKVPARVDRNTTLLSVMAVGRTAKYTFRLNVRKLDLDTRWYSLQKAKLTKDACDLPPIRKLLKDGASYVYMYIDKKNRHIVDIRVRDVDCPKF